MRNELFECNMICDNDILDIEKYATEQKRGYGLVAYLKRNAIQDQKNSVMRTYIIRSLGSKEIVGYFSLKAGAITAFKEVKGLKDIITRNFDSIPGIELANFSTNSEFKKNHPEYEKIGMIIFNDFVLPICRDVSNSIGVKFVYIFALPEKKLLDYYKNCLCFQRLDRIRELKTHQRIKPLYDQGCIFMYREI